MPDRAGWVTFPYLILLLYVSAFRSVLFRRFFRNSWITAVGGMFYTIYLLHYRLIPLRVEHGNVTKDSAAIPAVAYLLVLGVASCLYFLLVERPSMGKNWPRALTRQIARTKSRVRTDMSQHF
jgi:peptidoglycan/LPS O-acetylase OafA/YrhL